MKNGFLVLSLFLMSFGLKAEVVDLANLPVREVLDVYEDERPRAAADQEWIHSFEQVPLGKEMDHLANLKAGKDEELTE